MLCWISNGGTIRPTGTYGRSQPPVSLGSICAAMKNIARTARGWRWLRRQDAEQLESFAHRWGLLFPK